RIVDRVAGVGEDERALLAVEDRALVSIAAAAQAFPDDRRLVLELEGDDVRVGSLLIVVEPEPAARGADSARVIDPESPAAEVDHMHAVVSDLARSPVPEPMPVVMDDVVLVRAARRGPLPEIEVEPVGDLGRLTLSDRLARVPVPRARVIDAADHAAAELFHRFDDEGVAPPLVPHLTDARMLARGLDHELAFARRVAAGLLDVDMLPGRARENRRRRVPVVRRGDDERVDG